MKKKTLFDANWLEEDQFKSWLTSAKDFFNQRSKQGEAAVNQVN